MFVVAYPRECTETFQDGHVRAFNFFGGVPRRISYDNARTSVSQIIGAHSRKLTDGFLQLQSHYLFREHFCRVRCANEKGVVEGAVKFARLNYFVPVPQVKDFEELNAILEAQCRGDMERKLRGKGATKKELLEEERKAFLALPEAPFDACKKVSTTADSLSLLRFDCNDYSVPVRFAHHTVVVKGYVDQVRIFRKSPLSRAIIWNFWNASPEPSTIRCLLRIWTCPIAFTDCGNVLRKKPGTKGRGSIFWCCNC
jgi:hypothetical protein